MHYVSILTLLHLTFSVSINQITETNDNNNANRKFCEFLTWKENSTTPECLKLNRWASIH